MSVEQGDRVVGQQTRITPELRARYLSDGLWRDRPLHRYLADATERAPDRVAAVSVDGDTGEVTDRRTYAELSDLTAGVAGGLRSLGVGTGDAVSVMVPNRLEFSAIIYAIHAIGAVYTGIPIGYGAKDAAFILRRSKAKVLIVPQAHRRTDYIAFGLEIRAAAPDLEHIVVLGDAPAGEAGWLPFTELAAADPLRDRPAVDPGSLAQIGFTSGTTGEPKGVMNTHQTLDAVGRLWVEHVGVEMLEAAVDLIASPVGHHTGYIWGALLAANITGTAVYLDRWKPDVAARVMREHDVGLMVGAPTFLQDLVRVDGVGPESFPALRMIVLAGAPVPRTLIPRAREQLNSSILPAWGMTEYGIGISSASYLPQERVDATDGVPVRSCEVRVVDKDGVPGQRDEVGALQITGPGLFVGYYDRPDFTEQALVDGWFDTGDQAVMHEDGFVSLVGRSKDIIIRGGENIPVYEVENALFRHPAVVDVAVIGVPDERLGERTCAVLVGDGPDRPGFEELKAFCLEQGLSKHYLPERMEFIDALPKTASGKIKKFELRERFGR